MPVRALLFDLWGTLVQDAPPEQGGERRGARRARLTAEALAAHGLAYDQEAVAGGLGRFRERHGALQADGRDLAPPDRTELFLELLDPGIAGRLPAEARRAVEAALVESIRHQPPVPVPAAHDVLREAQRRRLRTGLVSNTGLSPGYVLRELLAEMALLPLLQVLTFSDEACLMKPAPEMFHCTLNALAVGPEDAVFIGDLPRTDVAGARAVGMWAVQVGDARADGIEPHARIATLGGLFPALERLGLLKS